MTTTGEQYVPSDDRVRGRYCDGTYLQTGSTTEGDDFDAWLARVRRDAWDEGQASGWSEAQEQWQINGAVGDMWKHADTPNPYREQEN